MSTDTSGAEWAGALLEDAIAAVLLNEMHDQRYTALEIQARSGVKSRSWGNYYVNRSRPIKTWAWVATGEALGLDPAEVIRRARVLMSSLSATDSELLAGLGASTRVKMLQEIARGGSVDPSGRSRADQDDGIGRTVTQHRRSA